MNNLRRTERLRPTSGIRRRFEEEEQFGERAMVGVGRGVEKVRETVTAKPNLAAMGGEDDEEGGWERDKGRKVKG